MPSAVNVGSINLPKMMRQLSHRTSQVRDLTFVRDAVYDKTYAKFRKDDASAAELSGPPVNFGYESTSTTTASYAKTQDRGSVTHSYTSTPELVLPGLTMLQSPIVSRSGRLERTGHRITGACTFYAPSLDYVKALDNFKDSKAFAELESYDKLYDRERIIIQGDAQNGYPTNSLSHGLAGFNPTQTLGTSSSNTCTMTIYNSGTAAGMSGYYPQGYEIDRAQFRVKRGAAAGSSNAYLTEIFIQGTGSAFSGNNPRLQWTPTSGTATDGAPLPTSEAYVVIDVPFNVDVGSTTMVYIGGTGYEYTLSHKYSEPTRFDTMGELIGDSTAYATYVGIKFENTDSSDATNFTVDPANTYIYKTAEWRVESIKDYRDEYMQIAAVRVRGERSSRRRTYG